MYQAKKQERNHVTIADAPGEENTMILFEKYHNKKQEYLLLIFCTAVRCHNGQI